MKNQKAELLFGLLDKMKRPYCAAVLVAGGNSSRMNGVDKVMADVAGQPMVVRAVMAFEENPNIREIVVVTRQNLIKPVSDLIVRAGARKVRLIVEGGNTRAESVLAGLSVVSKKAKLIAIHDAARPLVSQEIITKTYLAAAKSGAAAPSVPVKDTIKICDGGMATETPDRNTLVAVQTPQIFDADLIRAATQNALQKKLAVTDDCSAVEAMGMKITMTQGSEENLKVTTRLDLAVAVALAKKENQK